MLSADDQIAIRALVDLYGHIIDDRMFARAGEIFTQDARYDVSDFGMGVIVGVEAIVALWSAPDARHPLAHHATNIVLDEETADRVRVVSKGLGLRAGGGMGSVTYRDVAVRTASGWRIAERVAVLRR